MKKILLIGLQLLLILCINAQNTGIGTTTPDASALLELKSPSKGLLIPRMNTAAVNSISNPAKGLMVLDSSRNQLMINMGTSASPNWQTIVFKSGWSLTGNSNIDSATNFIGTTDAKPLLFRVYNIPAGQIHPLNYNTAFGLNAFVANSTGVYNTAVGYGTLNANTTGFANVAIGTTSLASNTTGFSNTGIGMAALSYNTTGNYNTATGYLALTANTTGSSNTAHGYGALSVNTAGGNNTANGMNALLNNTTGSYNTATGYYSLSQNTYGIYNTATGTDALYSNAGGIYNTAMGNESLYSNINGNYNTAVGSQALSSNISGTGNTAVGNNALKYIVDGSNNTVIGAYAGVGIAYPSVNNIIGIGNQNYLIGLSNYAVIGNGSTVAIGGNLPWTNFSDARIKRNINEDVIGLDFIRRLRPVTYYRSVKAMDEIMGNKPLDEYPEKYDIEKIKFTGFIAQEVEAAARASGYDFSGVTAPKNKNQLYMLSYGLFVVPLVKAVQEQQLIIENLQKQVEAVKAEIPIEIGKQQATIESQQKQIDELRAALDKLNQNKQK